MSKRWFKSAKPSLGVVPGDRMMAVVRYEDGSAGLDYCELSLGQKGGLVVNVLGTAAHVPWREYRKNVVRWCYPDVYFAKELKAATVYFPRGEGGAT